MFIFVQLQHTVAAAFVVFCVHKMNEPEGLFIICLLSKRRLQYLHWLLVMKLIPDVFNTSCKKEISQNNDVRTANEQNCHFCITVSKRCRNPCSILDLLVLHLEFSGMFSDLKESHFILYGKIKRKVLASEGVVGTDKLPQVMSPQSSWVGSDASI